MHSDPNVTNLQDTADLVLQVQSGDSQAYNTLLKRYYPHLLHLLHQKLTPAVRSTMDTQDLVQEVLIRTFPNLERFQYQGIGSFWAYLRKIAINHIRQVWKKQALNKIKSRLIDDSRFSPAAREKEPPEEVILNEEFEAFESALDRLAPKEREAYLMRMDLGCPYKIIASEMNFPSPDAARKNIVRVSNKLFQELQLGQKE